MRGGYRGVLAGAPPGRAAWGGLGEGGRLGLTQSQSLYLWAEGLWCPHLRRRLALAIWGTWPGTDRGPCAGCRSTATS